MRLPTYRAGRWAREYGRHASRALLLLAAFFVSAVAAQVEKRLELCATCHGAEGNSQTPGTPSIAGQPRIFLETQLILFREELRASPQKLPVMRGLTDWEVARIAEHFASLAAKPAGANEDEALHARGRVLAQKLRCGICHLPDFRGREQIPRLAGQREEYLVEAMIAFRDNRRPSGDTIMAATLYGISDTDIRAMAHFLSRYR